MKYWFTFEPPIISQELLLTIGFKKICIKDDTWKGNCVNEGQISWWKHILYPFWYSNYPVTLILKQKLHNEKHCFGLVMRLYCSLYKIIRLWQTSNKIKKALALCCMLSRCWLLITYKDNKINALYLPVSLFKLSD